MSGDPASVGDRADAAEFKLELLRRLGLPADASDGDIEAARNVLAEFLELAPRKAHLWTATQAADVDEAFALLSGPEQLLISTSQRASRAHRQPEATPERHGTTRVTPVTSAAAAARKPRRAQMMWAIAPLLVIGVVFLVFQMGNSSTAPDTSRHRQLSQPQRHRGLPVQSRSTLRRSPP